MVINRQLDFIGLRFYQLVDTISGKQQPAYVPFPRWIALFLRYIGTGYIGDPEDELACAMMSSTLINVVPKNGDHDLIRRMLYWIPRPYFCNPRPINYVPPVATPTNDQPEQQADQQPPSSSSSSVDDATTNTATATATANANATSSSSEMPSSSHSSALEKSTSCDTGAIPDSYSEQPVEAETNFSVPSSESPLITLPQPQSVNQHIYFHSSDSSSKGESHHTHLSPYPETPKNPSTTQQQAESANLNAQVRQTLTQLLELTRNIDQRLYNVETDVPLIKRHLIPDTTTQQPQPPPQSPPPRPPTGSPPRPPLPGPHPDDTIL